MRERHGMEYSIDYNFSHVPDRIVHMGVRIGYVLQKKEDVVYELLMFHVVKLPLFVAAWVVYMMIFVIICFSINGFEDIQ